MNTFPITDAIRADRIAIRAAIRTAATAVKAAMSTRATDRANRKTADRVITLTPIQTRIANRADRTAQRAAARVRAKCVRLGMNWSTENASRFPATRGIT